MVCCWHPKLLQDLLFPSGFSIQYRIRGLSRATHCLLAEMDNLNLLLQYKINLSSIPNNPLLALKNFFAYANRD